MGRTEQKWQVMYRGVSKSTQGIEYPPVIVFADRFISAALKAVMQVEEQEPGNFEVTSIVRIGGKSSSNTSQDQ